MKISFCIITLNEEKNLRRCLKSCADLADEIIVLDSGSTDATADIAADFGARFEHQDWLGYVGQKNKIIELARHDWIFSLDADEAISPGLYAELKILKQAPLTPEICGFDVPRCVFYEGRWIRHGDWYPDRLVRLFRRDCAHFAGGRVHERLEIAGRIASLENDLHHHSFRDAADHWERAQKYAWLWAEDKAEAGKRVRALEPALHAAFRWLRGYIFRAGFLDGPQGRRIAAMNAREVFLKYNLLRSLNQNRAE